MNSFFYNMVRKLISFYLDILVELERLSECQLLLCVKKIVHGIIIDLEVWAPDYEHSVLLTLGVFHSLKEFLQSKNEDSICVEVLGSDWCRLLLVGSRGGLQTFEVLQGGIQVGFQGVRIQDAVPLVVSTFRLALHHRGQGRHHRGSLDSWSHCHGLASYR